jgi:hypothetical protein
MPDLAFVSDDTLRYIHDSCKARYEAYRAELYKVSAEPFNPAWTDADIEENGIYTTNLVKQIKRNGTRMHRAYRHILHRDAREFAMAMSNLQRRQ